MAVKTRRRRRGGPHICKEDTVVITNIRMPKRLLDWAKCEPEGFSAKVRRLLMEDYEHVVGHPAYDAPIR